MPPVAARLAGADKKFTVSRLIVIPRTTGVQLQGTPEQSFVKLGFGTRFAFAAPGEAAATTRPTRITRPTRVARTAATIGVLPFPA